MMTDSWTTRWQQTQEFNPLPYEGNTLLITTNNNNMKDFNNNRAVNDKRVYRDSALSQMHLHNKLTRDFAPNDESAMEHTKDTTNRQQAQALLEKLKTREIKGSCIAWVDGQPSLIETTRNNSKNVDAWTNSGKRISMSGTPATDTEDRTPSGWESKMHYSRKRGYTLDETPTMAFKSSGHLPPHYYQDETALEAYVESLTKES